MLLMFISVILEEKFVKGEDEKLIHTIRGQGYVLRDPS